MPSVTKWNVVPPGHRDRSPRMMGQHEHGWWYGGLSPHQPFQSSSPHAPRIGPNMLRPMIVAPMPVSPGAANSLVQALVAARLADHRAEEPGGEHPLVQVFPADAERLFAALIGPGPVSVERDAEVVHTKLCHVSILPANR